MRTSVIWTAGVETVAGIDPHAKAINQSAITADHRVGRLDGFDLSDMMFSLAACNTTTDGESNGFSS